MDEHVNDDGKSREEILAEIEENEVDLMEGMVTELEMLADILEMVEQIDKELSHETQMKIIEELNKRLHEMNAVVRKNRGIQP